MKCPRCKGLGITYFVMEYDQICNLCKGKGKIKKRRYCEIYDAKYGRFGKWLENKCKGPNCDFCSNRPRRHPFLCGCKKRH